MSKFTKYQITILSKLLYLACLVRDGGICLRCGNTETLVASHIYPKGTYTKMRWNLENVKILCEKCHCWWHRNPDKRNGWLAYNIPAERRQRLLEQSRINDHTILDYKKIKQYLKDELSKYE